MNIHKSKLKNCAWQLLWFKFYNDITSHNRYEYHTYFQNVYHTSHNISVKITLPLILSNSYTWYDS